MTRHLEIFWEAQSKLVTCTVVNKHFNGLTSSDSGGKDVHVSLKRSTSQVSKLVAVERLATESLKTNYANK